MGGKCLCRVRNQRGVISPNRMELRGPANIESTNARLFRRRLGIIPRSAATVLQKERLAPAAQLTRRTARHRAWNVMRNASTLPHTTKSGCRAGQPPNRSRADPPSGHPLEICEYPSTARGHTRRDPVAKRLRANTSMGCLSIASPFCMRHIVGNRTKGCVGGVARRDRADAKQSGARRVGVEKKLRRRFHPWPEPCPQVSALSVG